MIDAGTAIILAEFSGDVVLGLFLGGLGKQVGRQAGFHKYSLKKEGGLVEVGPTPQMFTNPAKKQTEDYITGRFG